MILFCVVYDSHLMKFLESNKILSDFQHGSQKGRSCETQLITIIHDLTVRLHRLQQVDAVLLDFSKAFDKVPRHSLAEAPSPWHQRQESIVDPNFPCRQESTSCP